MKTNSATATCEHTTTQHWVEKAWPEGFKALAQFKDKAFSAGSVDAKTKAMIQLACVSMLRCKHCLGATVEKLKSDHKVSDQQIAEVMMVASYAAAGTNLAWAKEVFTEKLG